MPGDPIHRLTSPDGTLYMHGWRVACGAIHAQHATWDAQRVTCPACLRQCTCGPMVPLCPACAAHNRTQRGKPSHLPLLHTEKQFQEAVRQLALAQGWLYHHTFDSRKSPAGWVDTVLVRGPVAIFAELKMPGKQPTPAQKQWLKALEQVAYVSATIWTPEHWGEIEEMLQ